MDFKEVIQNYKVAQEVKSTALIDVIYSVKMFKIKLEKSTTFEAYMAEEVERSTMSVN